MLLERQIHGGSSLASTFASQVPYILPKKVEVLRAPVFTPIETTGILLEPTASQVQRLVDDARRAIVRLRPAGPLIERAFQLRDRAVILVGARIGGPRRVPRDSQLIRDTLAFGTGLQLRAFGPLAVVAIELPTLDNGLAGEIWQ